MRGPDERMDAMFCYSSPDSFVPQDHPLRPVRAMVEKALDDLSPEFSKMYSYTGRPSIPPEKLLKALLLQVFYSVRSVRLLMERIQHDILFRWFVGLSLSDPIWDHSTFSQNQERLLRSELSARFFEKVLEQARAKRWLSDEHFTVDGTLIEAWASMKSFRKKGEPPAPPSTRNDKIDFRNEKRSNETHASTTDPQARLIKKSRHGEARLGYSGNVLMENRNGLVVGTRLVEGSGTAEREAALSMLFRVKKKHRRITVGADKGYDSSSFVEAARAMKVIPHVAQNTTNRRSAIDGRTTSHPNYRTSQKIRKRVEEIFGWMKTVGTFRKTRHIGKQKVAWHFTLVAAAYNLVRMRNLLSSA